MSSWRLQVFAALICIILLSNICLTLASDDEDDDDEIIYKNVRKRKLVTPLTTARSILREHDKPATDTTTRSFPGVTLGYVTPWYARKRILFFCKNFSFAAMALKSVLTIF